MCAGTLVCTVEWRRNILLGSELLWPGDSCCLFSGGLLCVTGNVRVGLMMVFFHAGWRQY
jgi:hypothetical protein